MGKNTTYQCDLIGAFLSAEADKVGKYDFPQLQQNNYLPDTEVLPFNYITKAMFRKPCWYHCFINDKQFQRLYRNFWHYKEILTKFIKGLISTDFSLFRDMDEAEQIENCRKNRAVDYALQKLGISVIPTAGFAGESSWKWCFDGLPTNSTIAVTTNCIGNDPDAKRLFIGGIRAMVNKIQPNTIIVCGKCPDWLFTKYPKIKIVQIPNYSQMRRERSEL